jgi:hypothetical protein
MVKENHGGFNAGLAIQVGGSMVGDHNIQGRMTTKREIITLTSIISFTLQ